MSTYFTVKVVAPSGPVAEAETKELLLESSNGQITLLPEHADYTTLLGSGVLKFQDSNGKSYEFVSSGGFCRFSNNQALVLADYVDFREDLDSQEIMTATEELEKELSDADLNDPASLVLLEKLARLKAQQELVSH